MTQKELAHLKRIDLLALLVEQGREAGETQAALDEARQALEETARLAERLKARLDEKDAQIERLKARLDQKDVQLGQMAARIEDFTSGRYLEMEGIRSLTDISGRLDLMLRMAQKAVENYIGQVQKPLQGQGGAWQGGEIKEGTIQAP